MAEVIGRSYEIDGFPEIEEALTELLALFGKLLRQKLDAEHRHLLDDILGDLFNCAFGRAVDGGSAFFEELFTAYRAGGWPCGWLGEYPSGQLVVYFRK